MINNNVFSTHLNKDKDTTYKSNHSNKSNNNPLTNDNQPLKDKTNRYNQTHSNTDNSN